MKKYILIIVLLLTELGFAQALPTNRYYQNKSILDLENNPPSFAYSLRKMRKNYTGFAILVRRNTDNAEANVAFDTNGVVSINSIVTITAIGTSGLTVGQTMTYNTFIASQVTHVITWYDQGINAYHATQPTATAQPIIQLNIAGATNNLPSIVFDGNRNLVVNQPIQNLVLNGINGTFMLVTKPTSDSNQLSFGLQQTAPALWRWSLHLNWSDSNCYFDAAEYSSPSRAFANGLNINLYKQYTFIRGTSYKSVFINSTPTAIYNATGASSSAIGEVFGIGNWNSTTSGGYLGNVSEVIMFKKDYSQAVIKFLETNQIAFWGL